MKRNLRIGTRSSKLALWQANFVKDYLINNHPDLNVIIVPITTEGDINQEEFSDTNFNKGIFVKEIEDSLINKEIDIAIHSYKDLPAFLPNELEIIGVSNREDSRDVLISELNKNLNDFVKDSEIGTGSPRRTEQIKILNPEIVVKPIRGNVDTRIKKMKKGEYDGIVLAFAGIKRLGLEENVAYIFDYEEIVPAPLQGFLAVEARKNEDLSQYFQKFSTERDSLVANYESRFLKDINLDCDFPVGFSIRIDKDKIFYDYFFKGKQGSVKNHLESNINELDLTYNKIIEEIKPLI